MSRMSKQREQLLLRKRVTVEASSKQKHQAAEAAAAPSTMQILIKKFLLLSAIAFACAIASRADAAMVTTTITPTTDNFREVAASGAHSSTTAEAQSSSSSSYANNNQIREDKQLQQQLYSSIGSTTVGSNLLASSSAAAAASAASAATSASPHSPLTVSSGPSHSNPAPAQQTQTQQLQSQHQPNHHPHQQHLHHHLDQAAGSNIDREGSGANNRQFEETNYKLLHNNNNYKKQQLQLLQQEQSLPLTSAATKAPQTDLCQIKNGESVAIVEIEETRNGDNLFNLQPTNPRELPIIGSVADGEIELKIESETHKYFQLKGKKLELIKPLNRDPILRDNSPSPSSFQIQQAAISSVYIQLSCLVRGKLNETAGNHKVIVPILVKVIDINDNAPRFSAPKFTVQVNELAPVGTIILGSDQLRALDLDSANNGLVEYSLLGTNDNKQRLQTSTTTTTTTGSPALAGQSASSLGSIAPVAISTNTLIAKPRLHHHQQQNHQPTININNEPIQNGPMDDSDEESDESLLASLANSTTSMNGSPNGPGSSNSELFGLPHPPELPEMPESPEIPASMINLGNQQQQQRDSGDSSDFFASRKRSTKRKRRHENSRTKRTVILDSKVKQQHIKSPPWTNLMESVSPQVAQVHSGSIIDAQQFAQNQDSLDFFSLEMSPLGPQIRLKKELDFETRPLHQITIIATDKATNKTERLSSSAQIVIRVTDGDDQEPAFLLEQSGCATNSVPSAAAATTTMSPSITARYSTIASGDQSNSIERMQAAASQQTHSRSLHNGFRIISDLSDDFDFGDSADPLSNRNQQTQSPNSVIPQNIKQQQQQQQHASTTVAAANGNPNAAVDYFSCLGPSASVLGSSGIADYWASVMAGDSDQVVRILPQTIKARDRDLLNAPIEYSFVNGTPANYSHYFQINPLDGVVKQIAPIDRVSNMPDRFVIFLKAQKQTPKKHSSQARLTIEVKAADWSPPILEANFQAGSVHENAPIGTQVKQTPNGIPMRVKLVSKNPSSSVSTLHQTSAPSFKGVYEYETTSDLFKVDKDGFVYVAKENLDADLPTSPVYMFQVTAKLVGHALRNNDATSDGQSLIVSATNNQDQATLVTTPVSLNVTLLDLDDNGPQISSFASSSNNQSAESRQQQLSLLEPIQLMASSVASSSRHLLTLQATDRDLLSDHRQHKFSLLHVSQGARDRFKLDELSGDLRALGKFSIGEQFSLTVQVADSHQRQSLSILEVHVVPGPNLSAPQFVHNQATLNGNSNNQQISARSSVAAAATAASQLQQQLAIGDFQVEITEALAPHSSVFQLHAQDPENDPITYSIVGGNVNQDFYINANSGIVYLQNKLDREEVSQYNLLVQARDSGGLSTVRGLRIKILDTNDENPVFQQEQYEFTISENQPVGTILGRVRAHDADSGDFGRISYHLESNAPSVVNSKTRTSPIFAINEATGEIKLLEKLDYEQGRAYSLIVRAQDQDKRPRSASCRVSVHVLDVQDELPYFEPARQLISVEIWEDQAINKPLEKVSLQAIDPDTIQQITYELKWASVSNLFNVNPKTGELELLQAVDYEQAREFTLLIGTQESPLNESEIAQYLSRARSVADEKSPVCKIDIKILDLNDNAPIFEPTSVMPIRVKSSIQLGSQISQLIARDADGSKPNNQIRYEIVKPESVQNNQNNNNNNNNNESFSSYCGDYFMLDATSGHLFVKLDLRRLSDSECQLEIVCSDLGFNPASLSSRASLTIYIDHIAEQPTVASLLAFADGNFYAEINENSMPGSVVKVLPIINKSRKLTHTFPYSCELLNGNDELKFEIGENQFGDCEIRLRDQQLLDFEKTSRYVLSVRLNSLASGASAAHSQQQHQQTSIAQLVVNILDRNDNKPAIELPARYADLTQGKYLAVISADSPPERQVIQIKATDLDSPRSGNGLISYELIGSSSATAIDTQYASYFSIDQSSGIIRTNRPLDDIDELSQPIKLIVRARDNPVDESERVYETTVEVFVNLITIRHRIALSFPRVQTLNFVPQVKNDLLSVIQERSGLISGLERIESLKVTKRKSTTSPSSLHQLSLIESDVNGTDFWFYLIEPGTFKLVLNDDSRVKQSLFEDRAQKSLRDIIQQRLSLLNSGELRVRLPYQTITYDGNPINSSTGSSGLSFAGLAGGFKWLFGAASAMTSAATANLSESAADAMNRTATTETQTVAPKSPNYVTRVLFSLHNHYSKVAGDQYAGFLISFAILITISSLMMLVCQCKSTRKSSSKSSSSISSRSSRSQLNNHKHTTSLSKKQSRKLSKQNKKHKNQSRIDVTKDPQAAILQAQILQHQQQQQQQQQQHLNPLSANSYFLQLDQQQQQQQQGSLNANGSNSYESFAAANGHQIYGSSFSTANGLNSLKPSAIEQLYGTNGATGETLARMSKEYETQMQKMSVIYDDNYSVDGQHQQQQLRK